MYHRSQNDHFPLSSSSIIKCYAYTVTRNSYLKKRFYAKFIRFDREARADHRVCSGDGNLLAGGLAEYGAEIIINDRTQARADQAAQALVAQGFRAVGYAFDVTQATQVEQAIARIEAEVGAIDILINNAGIQRRFPFTEFPEEEWDNVIEVNQKGVFLVSQQVAKYMIGRRAGKIINICSMQSELGRKTITPYAASKGAVKMLTRGMCVELAEYNIQVNGIAPGYFATEMTTALVNDEAFSAWLYQRTPAARWGKPEELIGAAVYLASSAANFVNGHLLFVDGGMLAAV
nr:gluconate 5-dehydrogenase [Klebsiella oxytoca]